MKAYDLAKSLNHLARILRAGPNVELDEIGNLSLHASTPRKRSSRKGEGKGAAIALLSEIATYSKSELIELANDLDIPLQVRSADAVRDVLGKILKQIQDNPEVKEKLVASSDTSPEGNQLARALAILMNQ